MTRQEQHKLTHDRIVASLILADTRAQRHGVYPVRKPKRKKHEWSLPVVNERRPL